MNENESQLRAQLLEKLHGISFSAFLTVLPSEGCLEAVIMTSKGICHRWLGYEDWKVYYISPQVAAGFSETRKQFADDDEKCGRLLREYSDFAVQRSAPGDECFCFYDEQREGFRFFASWEEISEALGRYYSPADTSWEDMDLEALTQWWERYEQDGGDICCFEAAQED